MGIRLPCCTPDPRRSHSARPQNMVALSDLSKQIQGNRVEIQGWQQEGGGKPQEKGRVHPMSFQGDLELHEGGF